MTPAQLKQLVRQKIKKVAGGPPVGTVGSNRAEGMWDVFDALIDALGDVQGLTAAGLQALLKQGTGIDISLDNSQVLVSCTVVPAQAAPQPLAPTSGIVDDTADTFSFLPNPDYPAFSQYKVVGLPGVTGAVVLDATNSYVQGSRVVVKVVGAVAIGGLAVYVAGSGNVPDGQVLTNAQAFTGAVVTPAPTVTGFSPASAAPGASVTLTGTNFTGATAILFNGSATPTFQVLNATTATATVPGQATSGPLSLVTSAGTGTSAASFTVLAANRIPVADAGADLTVQLPTSSVALMGTASDPDPGDTVSQAWRFVTGPAGVAPTGVPATTQNVVVGNLTTEGLYQFGYRTTDTHGAQSVEDYVVVTVQAAATSTGGNSYIEDDYIEDGYYE